MIQRLMVLIGIAATTAACGCSGTGGYNGGNLLSNNGTRIAPPGTNLSQNPKQMAALPPDPYYGQTPGGSVQVNGMNGWLPSNAVNSGNQIANGYAAPNNNLTVASSTSTGTIFGGTTMASNPGMVPMGSTAYPSTTGQPQLSYGTPDSGAVPLTDATQIAASQVPSGYNSGYPTQPQYNPQSGYSNGTVVATGSTIPGFNATPNSNYSTNGGWQTGTPTGTPYPYPNAAPTNTTVANGWSTRPSSSR